MQLLGALLAAVIGTAGPVYRLPLDTNPPTLDPAQITDTASDGVAARLFNRLVKYQTAPDGRPELVGDLAQRWEVLDGGRRFRFHLHRDVRFHHGRVMTAADVKSSLQRLMDPPVASKRTWVVKPIVGAEAMLAGQATEAAGIRVLDPHTVEIEIVRPYAPFLAQLAMVTAAVIPIEKARELGKAFGQQPVGTGPFRLKRWALNQVVELERFEGYFRGPAKLAGLEFRIVPEPLVQLQEYRNGRFEHVSVPPGHLKAIQTGELADQLRVYTLLSVYYLGFNLRQAPWKDNRDLRRALNYAINRQVLCEKIMEGRWEPADGVLPPALRGGPGRTAGYTYDPAKARQLLEAAGFPAGRGLPPLVLVYNTQGANAKIAQRVQSDLKKVGVEVSLRGMDWAAYLDLLDRGQASFFRLGWVADYPDPDNFLFVLFHSSQHGEQGNHTFYSDRQVDRWLEEARTTDDPARRRELYAQAEQRIVDDAPWVFLAYGRNALLVKPYVRGLRLGGMDAGSEVGQVDFHQVWLESH